MWEWVRVPDWWGRATLHPRTVGDFSSPIPLGLWAEFDGVKPFYTFGQCAYSILPLTHRGTMLWRKVENSLFGEKNVCPRRVSKFLQVPIIYRQHNWLIFLKKKKETCVLKCHLRNKIDTLYKMTTVCEVLANWPIFLLTVSVYLFIPWNNVHKEQWMTSYSCFNI